MLIIGLAGAARSGKDTCADYLVYNYGFFKHSFAEPLKAMLSTLGFSKEQLYGNEKGIFDEHFQCTPRHAMQTLGTEWGRDHIHPDIWVRHLRKFLNDMYTGDAAIVIPDVRFPNEVEWIREVGMLWHIQRDTAGIEGAHVSEAGVIPLMEETVIFNNSSIASFHDTIDDCIKPLML